MGFLGNESFLTPAQALSWVGLDIHTALHRFIWQHFCSHRVLIEGYAEDGKHHFVHYQLRGAHWLNAEGTIQGYDRRGALPPPDVQWGYEPTSVAALRRTSDAIMIKAANVADGLGQNIWLVGTGKFRSLDEEALEPEGKREDRHIRPSLFAKTAVIRAFSKLEAVKQHLELGVTLDPNDSTPAGMADRELLSLLETMTDEQRELLIRDLSINILKKDLEEKKVKAAHLIKGKRIRSYKLPYIFNPSGRVVLNHRLSQTKNTSETLVSTSRLHEIADIYTSLIEHGYFEELAPERHLEEVGITLSPVFETLDSPFDGASDEQHSDAQPEQDVDGARLTLKPHLGPRQHARFLELQASLLIAFQYSSYQAKATAPTSHLKKTCEWCNQEFVAKNRRFKICDSCGPGDTPEQRQKYNRERMARLRADKKQRDV